MFVYFLNLNSTQKLKFNVYNQKGGGGGGGYVYEKLTGSTAINTLSFVKEKVSRKKNLLKKKEINVGGIIFVTLLGTTCPKTTCLINRKKRSLRSRYLDLESQTNQNFFTCHKHNKE